MRWHALRALARASRHPFSLARHAAFTHRRDTPLQGARCALHDHASAASRDLALPGKPHRQRLCGQRTAARVACAAACRRMDASARDAPRGTRSARITQSAEHASAAAKLRHDDDRVRASRDNIARVARSDARTQRFASKQQREHRRSVAIEQSEHAREASRQHFRRVRAGRLPSLLPSLSTRAHPLTLRLEESARGSPRWCEGGPRGAGSESYVRLEDCFSASIAVRIAATQKTANDACMRLCG